MNNKRVVVIGLSVFIVILIMGAVSVFAFDSQTKIWDHHKDSNYEKHGEYSHESFEGKGVWFGKMGHDKNMINGEVMAAKKKYWEQHITLIKEKLGLPADATDEEVKVAMQELKEDWSSMKMHDSSMYKHGAK
jgi:hypothetical protein